MSRAQIVISIRATDEPERFGRLIAAAVSREGEPISGARVHYKIEGDGTFDSMQSVTELDAKSNTDGEAFAT